MQNAHRFEGKKVLVTGGNSGIGLATAKHLTEEGATVFISGRRQAELDRATSQLGDRVTAIQGDITKSDDLDRLYAIIEKRAGVLDAVVANAGGGNFAPLGSYTEAHLDETFALNVKGTAFTVQKALPLLRDGGSVVLVGSLASVRGSAALGVYAAAKAALRSFVRTWSVELKARHIRFNVVSPGIVPTPAYDLLGIKVDDFDAVLPTIPLGRLGTTDEIANAILFFASDQSSYITGTELFVDGGLTQV